MFAFLRITMGLILLVAGLEKLISPYQNFQYAIEAYQALPGWAEELTARIFPWVEFIVGVLLVLGLWTSWALRAGLVNFAIFITIVGQALIRHLPIDNCGCFGQLIHLPSRTVIVFDSVILLLLYFLLRYPSKASGFGLDKYFEA